VHLPLLIYCFTPQTDILDWEFLVKVSLHTALSRTMWIHSIRTCRFLVQQKDLRNELLKLVLFIFPQSNSLFGGVVLFDRGVWAFVSIFFPRLLLLQDKKLLWLILPNHHVRPRHWKKSLF